MKSIPYGRQSIDEGDVKAVSDVLHSDFLTTGPKVGEFEAALCSYLQVKGCVAVSNGTAALELAVSALGIPAGSEIITTPFTFAASANCAIYNNCKPVFADIDRGTYNLDPQAVKKKITKKTKAIVYVDYAGQPADIRELQEIAKEKGLFLIEDAAHALGAEYEGKRVGGFADATTFSFHPVKHITTGEGGAVTSEREEVCAKVRLLRSHGIDRTPSERSSFIYDMKELGRNYRITDMQCALGISQLKRMDVFLKRREEIAKRYDRELPALGVEVPYVEKNARHARHLYTVLVPKGVRRGEVFAGMRKRGIGVNVHYIPIYKFSYYRKNFPQKEEEFPITEEVYSRIISLPMYYGLSDEEIEGVVKALGESIREAKA